MESACERGDVALAVLAGGAGSRMGGPKQGLRIGGEPILARLLKRAAWKGPTVLVLGVAGEPGEGAETFDVVARDAVAGEGPARGVLTAVEACRAAAVVVVPVDMPNIGSRELGWVAERWRERAGSLGVLLRARSRGHERIEPFPSVFSGGAALALRSFLGRGERAVHRLNTVPGIEIIDAPADWGPQVWENLNTPEDLRRVEGGASTGH